MTPNPSHRRRLRSDRFGRMIAAAATALVLLTALMLVAYLLSSLRLLLGSDAVTTAQQWQQPMTQPLLHIELDGDAPAVALMLAAGELQAMQMDAEAQSLAVHGNVNAALQEVKQPSLVEQAHWLPLAARQLLLLDVVAGVGLLRWNRSEEPNAASGAAAEPSLSAAQAVPAIMAQLEWMAWPDSDQLQPEFEQQLLLAAVSAGQQRLQLLTLWQQADAAWLRWYALAMGPELGVELLREQPLQGLSQQHLGMQISERSAAVDTSTTISAQDITSLLPDASAGAYLGLVDGTLLQLAASSAPGVQVLQSATDSELLALYGLRRGGLLAAHANGSIAEFSRARPVKLPWKLAGELAGELQPINHYQCAAQRLTAIAVDRQHSRLACVGDDILSLFQLGRSQPLWQTGLQAAPDTAAATLLDLDDARLLLVRAAEAGEVTVNSWQFAAEPVVDGHTLWWPRHEQGDAQAGWLWEPHREPQASKQTSARLSLLPLLFGTFKAALLGMLIALPLALLGAIHTALLLPRRWRERIKPLAEMLESLPTVILGFIGALWLAPLLQQHLLSLWLILLLLPLSLPLSGYFWTSRLQYHVAAGLRPGLVYLLFAVQLLLLFALGMLLQRFLFAGSFTAWLESAAGWSYDLHNALLVGLVLGVAIAPTIFSLVEDALSAVPRRLQEASLALGASQWQTVWQVILPAAGAGILAALLIGFGRALGETMIVLMVSSNTPIMESSLLRGLQAIAPTLAREMPQITPASVLFRVLLLATLVLFGLTLVMHSVAELLRARLRLRYRS